MIAGYLLIAIVVGFVASTTGLVFGASLLTAFGLYALAGTASLILLPLTHLLLTAAAHQNKTHQPNLGRAGKTI